MSHALEIVNLDVNDQKIVNDAIIKEKLTVGEVKDIVKHLRMDNIERL